MMPDQLEHTSCRFLALAKSQQDKKSANTVALWAAVNRLRKVKNQEKWTYAEVCKLALLKSTNPLKAMWNIDIKVEIDSHNKEIEKGTSKTEKKVSDSRMFRDSIRAMRVKLAAQERQLAQALGQIALWEAEANAFERECAELRDINARLLKRLD